MTIGTDTSVRIDGIAAGGEGVGRLVDGRAVFVHRTAPGDLAQVRVTHAKPRWARARLRTLLEPSPQRVPAPCPRYDRCGGCTLEHVDYDEQRKWKARILEEALRRIGGIRLEVGLPVPSPERFGYRNRMTFRLRRLPGGRIVAGLHELEAPHRILDIGGECLLPSPVLARAWADLRRAWGPGAEKLPAGRELRLTVREMCEGVVLVVRGGRGACDGQGLVAEVPDLVAVWRADRNEAPRLLAGLRDPTETWLGERYALGPTAFVQVNPGAAQILQARVLELAAGYPGSVVDAYAGVGVFGRALAAAGRPTSVIELDGAAASAAAEDAPDGLRVIAGRVEEHLAAELPAGLVLVNPPRAGLHPEVLRILKAAPPAALVYVSCDPATLARDLKRLAPVLRPVVVEAFDLFPQTAHVEAVVVLEREAAGE